MKMKHKVTLLVYLLTASMLLGIFASCTGNENPGNGTESDTPTDSESSSAETPGETDGETDGEPAGETESESETEGDSPDLSTDLYPTYQVYEHMSTQSNIQAVNIHIEGERFYEKNLPGCDTPAVTEFSNGSMVRCVAGVDSLGDGWQENAYSVSYQVNIPITGTYYLEALTSDLGRAYTSDFYIDVDGERRLDAGEVFERLESMEFAYDKSLFKLMDLTTLELTAGEHIITFTMNNEDVAADGRISFFLDYFTLERQLDVTQGISLVYDVDMSAVEDSELILAAGEVYVFDSTYPVQMTLSRHFATAETMTYTVADFFGNTVYEGEVEGQENDLVTVTRGIKNHPTGYFTATFGEFTYPYVVTPALSDRTLEDSPFAMDFAAWYFLRNDIEKCYSLSAAARLCGVTWVRERAGWGDYEPSKGEYDFTSTEEVYRTIDKAGLSILAMISGSPDWATEGYGESTPDVVPGGYIDTQLSIYQMMKELVTYYDGIVDGWEIGNEMDHHYWGAETAEVYAAYFKAAALGAYAANPDIVVSFGGFEGNNTVRDYEHLLMMNDVMKYSGIYNFHSHSALSEGLNSFVAGSQTINHYATRVLYETYVKPTWITEAGKYIDSRKPTADDLTAQAPYIVTSTVQSLAAGTEKHFWFLLSPIIENDRDFGSFSSNTYQPYPILAAEAVMTDVLGKATYLGELLGTPTDTYSYLFDTGERTVAVVWTAEDETTYTFKSDASVTVTDIMGGETVLEPDEDGEITVDIGAIPVYITYGSAPATYMKHDLTNAQIESPTFSLGDKVVLSLEFEDRYNIVDLHARVYGHLISDGDTLGVRVSNFNDVAVTGTVSMSIPGFELLGLDQEITVEPYADGVITLTLKKTSDDYFNDFVTCTGTFNGESTSAATANVCTEYREDYGKVTFVNMRHGKAYPIAQLADVQATYQNIDGTVEVYLNEDKWEKFTVDDGGNISIDLSGLEPGKYYLVVSVVTAGGDHTYARITFRHNGKIAKFSNYM